MISAFALSQVFAAGTFVLALTAYQYKSQKVVLSLLTLAQICASIHFFLLDSIIGGVLLAFGALRFFSGIWSKHIYFKYFFISGTLILGFAVLDVWHGLLPIAGGIFGTLAAFSPSAKHMRQFLIGGTLVTLLFNLILFSPVAIASGLFFLTSNLVGYWRFYMLKKKI